MDIFFQDPSEVPLPPAEVRIRQFTAIPWFEGRRVRIYLEVDPFQKRPSADVTILNEQGEAVSEISIIESMTRKMEFNIHLRLPDLLGRYQAQVVLYYENTPLQADATTLEEKRPPLIVDRRSLEFAITS